MIRQLRSFNVNVLYVLRDRNVFNVYIVLIEMFAFRPLFNICLGDIY